MYLKSNQRLNQMYSKGLADEQKVIELLRSQGYEVNPSSQEDNKELDIDCYVNGKSVSIKSNHKGVWFKHICFELANHLTSRADCEVTKKTIDNLQSLEDVQRLLQLPSWESGWYYTGQASNYLFYQGNKLRLYTKKSIESYVAANGFLRIRPLTEDSRSYLGGRYRHCNTISGYLDWNSVPHRIWDIL